MLLSHDRLLELCRNGMIEGFKETAINAASIDVHLGPTILVESVGELLPVVDYQRRDPLHMRSIALAELDSYRLMPGEFILAQTVERFHLPLNISADYKLKSSMARIGLEHLNAGWCDAGWNTSVLTLELKNMTNQHRIAIRAGDAIGQIVFFEHEPVSPEKGYGIRGRYNGDSTVSGIKK